MNRGWRYESARHALAAKGIKTGRQYYAKGFLDKFMVKPDVRDDVPKIFWEYKNAPFVKGRKIIANTHDGIAFVEAGKKYEISPEIDVLTSGKVSKYRWVEEKFIKSAPLSVLKKQYGSDMEMG